MKISVLTVIPSEVIMLYKADVRGIPDKILDDYKKISKTYPEDIDIRQRYCSQIKWTAWKEKLKSQIEVEIEYKKRYIPKKTNLP
jgi:hypothetical protein